MLSRRATLVGTALVVLYTMMISGADAITKLIASGYAAPQLFVVSGFLVVALSWGAARLKGEGQSLRTICPKAMAMRSALTVVGSVAFFHAFRLLPLAEVFVFIGMMPIFAGLFSAPILHEHVRPMAWAALCAGFVGMLCLFPGGISTVSTGYLVALFACVCGTLSLVLARYIGQHENNSLAQVFYPNLSLAVVMAAVLPFVFKPMPITDVMWMLAYGVLLFAARWLSVIALRLMAAYTVTPLMNLQFVWMVVLGALFFGEFPALHIYLGVSIVIGSGVFLVYDQMQPEGVPYPWVGRFKLALERWGYTRASTRSSL
ncbi:DMT family transporter [Shimia abyssi]|uniref:EamA-like transporter family protein n=1 Tax=Shimia abyssi TaxID=1662395 RepID=A0A2P8FIS3_9RHOB|nr:DMT family transporter [Shimia abyssi]PSL21613.1 EamA-like transporter family protein [Shimia abyssi]